MLLEFAIGKVEIKEKYKYINGSFELTYFLFLKK
jgi:hypothetical protein